MADVAEIKAGDIFTIMRPFMNGAGTGIEERPVRCEIIAVQPNEVASFRLLEGSQRHVMFHFVSAFTKVQDNG